MDLDELASLTGLSPRTIRFYMSSGLLPHPSSRGRGADYGEEHLLRLRLIRRMSEEKIPISRQRELLDQMSVDEMRARVEGATPPSRTAAGFIQGLLDRASGSGSSSPATPPPPAAASSPTSPLPAAPVSPVSCGDDASSPRSRPDAVLWKQWQLARGVELHVRVDEERHQGALIDRILEEARRYRHTRRS